VAALVPRQKSVPASAYALDLVRTPWAWGAGTLLIATSLVIGYVAGITLAGVALAATWISATRPAVQRKLDRARAQERFRRARDLRESRLEEEGLSCQPLATLTELVDRIAGSQAGLRVDLEILLDRYVDLALARHRLRDWITSAALAPAGAKQALCSAVVRLRTAHVDRCRARELEIERELDAIAQRIRMLAERLADMAP
jgi:hypothetical protein